MTVDSLLKERKLKEDGMYRLLGRAEILEYDLAEDMSSSAKKLIQVEISRLRNNAYQLELGIRNINKKIERLERSMYGN